MATRIRTGLLGLLLLALAACGELGDLQDRLLGNPDDDGATASDNAAGVDLPAGAYLVCLTNVGHTMLAFDLATRQVVAGSRVTVDLDPVGPWFHRGTGYYLSRVDGSGAGANALIAFEPRSFRETDRLQFPPNSNPNTLLVLPERSGQAWVALRGSTFDDFATNGIVVVDLSALRDTAYVPLNTLAPDVPGELTSLVGFTWDAACGSAGCAYALVNNWNGTTRDGWVLVLEPDVNGTPTLRDAIAVGNNPQAPMLLDGNRRLWVVNNGGYADFNGQPGTVQALDATAFADGVAGNESLAVLNVGGDPTAIYRFTSGEAWVTTYPDDTLRRVDLDQQALLPAGDDLPRVTGPFWHTSQPETALYGGDGGFTSAQLTRLDTTTGAAQAAFGLEAGNGPLDCGELTLS